MRLYRTPAGSWAGTQDDAKALAKTEGTSWSQIEVPVDKPGLLAFLNEHRVAGEVCTADAEAPSILPDLDQSLTRMAEIVPRPMDATSILSRLAGASGEVDAIVDVISASRGYTLKRYAGAVSVAFLALSG